MKTPKSQRKLAHSAKEKRDSRAIPDTDAFIATHPERHFVLPACRYTPPTLQPMGDGWGGTRAAA